MKLLQTVQRKIYFGGFFIGVGKIVMAVISCSWLMLIYAVYNIIKASATHCASKEHQGRYSTMFYSGLLVVAASTVYLIYSVYIYFFGSTVFYHLYIAIGIAAVTTYELIVTVHDLRKAKKNKNTEKETLKYINLAFALISVSLTQTAILSYTNKGIDMSYAYAVGDAVFGLLALIVGISMLIRANQLDKIY